MIESTAAPTTCINPKCPGLMYEVKYRPECDGYRVECCCGATGPFAKTEHEAIGIFRYMGNLESGPSEKTEHLLKDAKFTVGDVVRWGDGLFKIYGGPYRESPVSKTTYRLESISGSDFAPMVDQDELELDADSRTLAMLIGDYEAAKRKAQELRYAQRLEEEAAMAIIHRIGGDYGRVVVRLGGKHYLVVRALKCSRPAVSVEPIEIVD